MISIESPYISRIEVYVRTLEKNIQGGKKKIWGYCLELQRGQESIKNQEEKECGNQKIQGYVKHIRTNKNEEKWKIIKHMQAIEYVILLLAGNI